MAKADASITDKEMHGLSDQERAALEDDETETTDIGEEGDETEDTEVKAKAAKAGDADDETDKDEEETEVAAAAKDGTKPAVAETKPTTTETTAAASETITEDDDDLVVPRSLRRTVVAVDKFDEQLKVLNTDMAEATRQFRANEIETEDYTAKQQEISDKRADLRALKRAEDDAVAFNRDADTHDWLTLVDVYKRHIAKTDGINYDKDTIKVGDKDVTLLDELDRMVKALGNDASNAEKPNKWFLKEADAIVRARYGLSKKPDAPADKKPVKAEDRRPKDKIPKTLGDAPAASDTETLDDEGEFAGLDKLGGLELEAAVARMTPAQQDRYARAN